MYLSTLSVSVTATKCDCNFSVKIKSTEFLNEIQWAFLKFDKIDEFKKIKINKIRILGLGRGLGQCHTCDFVARVRRDFIARQNRCRRRATVELHAATLSRKQTRLLHHFSRFTMLLHKHSTKTVKLFHI